MHQKAIVFKLEGTDLHSTCLVINLGAKNAQGKEINIKELMKSIDERLSHNYQGKVFRMKITKMWGKKSVLVDCGEHFETLRSIILEHVQNRFEKDYPNCINYDRKAHNVIPNDIYTPIKTHINIDGDFSKFDPINLNTNIGSEFDVYLSLQ